MEPELNQLNQFLGEENSFNLISGLNNLPGGRFASDYRNNQFLFSPAANQFQNRIVGFATPYSLNQNEYYYEDHNENSLDNDDNNRYKHLPNTHDGINKVLDFEDSQKFPIPPIEPATVHKTNKYIECSQRSLKNRGGNRKNSKGLRNLSQSVYKIVLAQKISTYKEVADELVRMLNNGQFGDIQDQKDKSKDQQNIKRRVYDALNVLIAANVLKKNGKFVISDDQMLPDKMRFPGRSSNKKQSPAELLEQINKKKTEINEKRLVLQELKMKKQLLESVVKRNKKKKYPIEQQLNFPLVGFICESDSKDMGISIKNSNNIVSIKNINSVTNIIGDLDLLMQIGFDVAGQSIEQIIEEVDDEEYNSEFLMKQLKFEVKREESSHNIKLQQGVSVLTKQDKKSEQKSEKKNKKSAL